MLGLLTDGERSGYDLLRAAEQSVGFFWTPAKTQLYAVLRKLVENGFATSRLVRQTDRPDKTLYRSRRGARAPARPASSRSARTSTATRSSCGSSTAHTGPREAVIADLERVRDHAARASRRARANRADVRPREHLFPYLTLLRGQGDRGGADIRWAEQALDC